MSEKKSITFDLEEAWEKTKEEFSYGTTSGKIGATATLLGKGLFNASISIGKGMIEKTKEASDIAATYDDKDEQYLRDKRQKGTIAEEMAANIALKKKREEG